MSQAFHGGRMAEAALEFGIPMEQLIDFSSNINPFASPISEDSWGEWKKEVGRYPEADAMSLQRQLADLYQVSAECLLPTSGGTEALYLVARLFSDKKVGIIEPAFSDYGRAFVAGGQTPHHVALTLNLWAEPITAWADYLSRFDVIVIGNPNNPTGSFQSRENFQSIWNSSSFASKFWIIDEAFIEFVPHADRETLLLDLFSNVIVLRSLTKSWALPGLRLGFAATSNPSWMQRLREMQPPWSINSLAQIWAKEFLTCENHKYLQTGLLALQEVKLRFVERLRRNSNIRVHPSVANFLLLELCQLKTDSATLYHRLGQRGLIVRRCDSFHGLPKGRFIRVAVKTEHDNNLLVSALEEICREDV